MYNSSLKAKVSELVLELEKISSIKFGQKWSVSNMNVMSDTVSERIMRTTWYTNDGRSRTKAYFISVYDNAFTVLDSVFTNVANYILPNDFPKSKQFKLIKKIMINIVSANTGLTNIKGSYSDDKEFGKWIHSFIKSINKKVTDAHYRLQNYLIAGGLIDPRVRDNVKLMKAESVSLSPGSAPIDIPGVKIPKPTPLPMPIKPLKNSSTGAEPIYMSTMEFEGDPSEDSSGAEPDKKVEHFVENMENVLQLQMDSSDDQEMF